VNGRFLLHNGHQIVLLQGGFMHTRIFCCLLVLVGFSAAQDSNFPVGPQYLMNYGSPIFARPIATPSLSLGTPVVVSEITQDNVAAADNETVAHIPEFQPQIDLFPIYYGLPRVSVIELSFREPGESSASLHPLPTGIVETGVVELTDMQSLRLRGYGVTLPEAAAYWKARRISPPRVYTNVDTERLRSRD
jgi:hypothetical protein